MFSVESAPFFFVLFLVSFDGFILIHMSHFVNTNFVFSCYFSVLFSPRMPAISFHLVIAPSYLFIYHRSHIINVMQTVTGNVCVNSNKSATRTSLFSLLFFLPIFPFSSIIMILVHFGTCFFICRQFFHILLVPAILMFSFFDDFHDHFHTYALKR